MLPYGAGLLDLARAEVWGLTLTLALTLTLELSPDRGVGPGNPGRSA